MWKLVGTFLVLLQSFAPAVCYAQSVTFRNQTKNSFELHVRNGPIDTPPDNRGSKNTTMSAGESWSDDVGAGDTWFAYGNQIVNSGDNPVLCNARGGQTVYLDRSHPCFVDN